MAISLIDLRLNLLENYTHSELFFFRLNNQLDLDAFHESEAYALMYSAYKMTEQEIKSTSKGLFKEACAEIEQTDNPERFEFKRIRNLHEDTSLGDQLERKLKPSSKLFGKAFKLSTFWNKLSRLKIPIVIIGFLVLLCFYLPPLFVVILMVILIIERLLSKWFGVKSFVLSLVILMPLLLTWLILTIIKKLATNWYLKEGRLDFKKK